MPTPPERCTSRPICAHEPTVAQVSTIVPGADPRADVDVAGHEHDAGLDEGAVADGRRAARRARRLGPAGLQRDLVVELEGADLDGLHAARAEGEQDRLLDPLVDVPAGVGRRRDAHAAVVEQGQRLLDGGRGLVAEVARRALVELLDLGGEGGQVGGGAHALMLGARRRGGSPRGSGRARCGRGPRRRGRRTSPGRSTMPCSSSRRSASASASSPPGTRSHRKNDASPPEGRRPSLEQRGQERVALGPVALADLDHVRPRRPTRPPPRAG